MQHPEEKNHAMFMVQRVGGGSVISGAYPVLFLLDSGKLEGGKYDDAPCAIQNTR